MKRIQIVGATISLALLTSCASSPSQSNQSAYSAPTSDQSAVITRLQAQRSSEAATLPPQTNQSAVTAPQNKTAEPASLPEPTDSPEPKILSLGAGAGQVYVYTAPSGAKLYTYSKGTAARGTMGTGTVSFSPGGMMMRKRYTGVGDHIVNDRVTQRAIKVTFGMTLQELDQLGTISGITYKKITDEQIQVGDATFYFKDGKLNEIED